MNWIKLTDTTSVNLDKVKCIETYREGSFYCTRFTFGNGHYREMLTKNESEAKTFLLKVNNKLELF